MERRFKITADAVERRCRCPEPGEVNARGKPVRQRIYWCSELPGFGVLASLTVKSFIVQKDIGGRTVRVSIGRYPTWAPDAARRRARELLVDMDRGIDPHARAREEAARQRRSEWERYTLDQAIAEHVLRMRAKGCAQRSMDTMGELVERYMPDWRSRPLVAITRTDCVARHRRVSAEHGPVVANSAMRILRAAYNSARKLHPELPPNPVEAVEFNAQRRKRSPIPWGELPAWWERVWAIENPVRRDLHILTLLTGLRSGDAKTIRWADVDFDAGTLHRPRPKGGVDRAFTIPLCRFALAMLARRRMDNLRYFSSDQGWVFPSRDREGRVTHVREQKEYRYAKGAGDELRKERYLPSPHRLRDTFASACREAGVGLFETKVLMNHVLPEQDVTESYQRPSMDYLRGCVERVAAFLLARAKVDADGRPLRATGTEGA
jgi:integrase